LVVDLLTRTTDKDGSKCPSKIILSPWNRL
jgi:hypothetical protein